MEFKPRVPREGVNYSRTHPLQDLAVLLAGVLALGVGAFFLLSFLLSFAVRLIPPKKEADLFAGLIEEIHPLLADASYSDRQAELRLLLDQLLEGWPEAPYGFKLAIIDNSDPNALALPGGLILVTSGLLDEVTTDDGLAFVLSHELGHYAHRDHLRQLSRGVAWGVVVSLSTGSGSAAAPDLLRLSGEVSQRKFSQRQESAADLFALELLYKSHGHVGGATEFFTSMIESGHDEGSFLSTHPAPRARIERLERAIAREGWPLS